MQMSRKDLGSILGMSLQHCHLGEVGSGEGVWTRLRVADTQPKSMTREGTECAVDILIGATFLWIVPMAFRFISLLLIYDSDNTSCHILAFSCCIQKKGLPRWSQLPPESDSVVCVLVLGSLLLP